MIIIITIKISKGIYKYKYNLVERKNVITLKKERDRDEKRLCIHRNAQIQRWERKPYKLLIRLAFNIISSFYNNCNQQ